LTLAHPPLREPLQNPIDNSLDGAPRGEGPSVRWFELRRDIPPWGYRALAASGFLLVLGAWVLISRRELVDPVFLPSPGSVWGAFKACFEDDTLWIDVKASAYRVTAGFLLAAAMAIPVGLGMGSFKVLEGLLQPFTEFVRYVPVPALIPILMVVFGIDELSKVMLIWAGTFFQLALMVADEVRRVPYELLQVSYTLGAKKREVIRLVVWRAAMPGIFDALRLCNGWAWTYLVVAELIGEKSGISAFLYQQQRYRNFENVYAGIVMIGIIGLVTDQTLGFLGRYLFPWESGNRKLYRAIGGLRKAKAAPATSAAAVQDAA
jgi:NitT/TauT family transport system permease protein